MDRKPKAGRVASKEVLEDDPKQSERFVKAARLAETDKTSARFENALQVVIKPKHGRP
jgi:hypothetical protein